MPADPNFVPQTLDATRWDEIEPLMRSLLDREVDSGSAFERWLFDRSELDAACSESRAILSINMTCHTSDAGASGAYARYIEEVPPKLRPLAFELDKKQTALHERFPLDRVRYAVLERGVRAEVELFRAANVPLFTTLEQLAQDYQTVIGAMTVQFDGEERTLPQMAKYQLVLDRGVREASWRIVAERRLLDRARIDAIYDTMLDLRQKIATNAGFQSFRDYTFRAMRRFDYTPAHCEAFHNAAEKRVVPFLRRLNERRALNLGLPALRPWDLGVDELGRPPLKPFSTGDELLTKSRRVFAKMGHGLDTMFNTLGDNGTPGPCFDLDSRKGKAPGGYQEMLHRSRRPFIFMNAAGMQSDVETMVHEAGHAFHSMLCAGEPLVAYREAPIEFAEVASIGMELLSVPAWDEFYPDAETRARAVRQHLERSIMLLAWIAQIDAFQHWVYTRPGGTSPDAAERCAHWLSLDQRFGPSLDWSGIEPAREAMWHRQLHLFVYPFYYIEYGIAQLGAMGLWLHSLEKGQASALELYKRALSLGGSKPLPELFEAAGLPFDFGDSTVARLVDAAERHLETLPQ